MRRGIGILAGLALSIVATAPAQARTKADKQGAAQPVACFCDDMEKFTTAVGLSEEQQKKLQEIKAARSAALAKWDEAHQKRMVAIKERLGKLTGKKDARPRWQLERELKVLQTGRDRLLGTHEKNLFAVLTRPQRGKWNGPILAESVLKQFAALALDEKQVQKVHALCRTRGEGISAPVDPKRHEATFKAVTQQAYATVLTPAQRKQFDKLAKPAQARRRQTGTTRNRSKRK